MTAKTYEHNNREGDPVQVLLRLPKQGLETRITRLEEEMGVRQKLNNTTLSSLGTKKLQLEDRLGRTRYARNPDQARRDNESQLLAIEDLKRREALDNFEARFRLAEQLEQAQQELDEQRQRLKLIDSETADHHSI